jgi:hypothetical protein
MRDLDSLRRDTGRKREPTRVLPAVIALALFFLLLAASGCQSTKGLQQGAAPAPTPTPTQPPSAKHQYRYYPDSAVYMDVARKTFFYCRGEKWITTTLLPPSVHVDWKKYVLLELDTDKPYLHHADIAKKYPPAQGKIREKSQTGSY